MPQKILTDDAWTDALTRVVEHGRALHKDVVYNGVTYTAGDHEFTNDGRYWTGFDRLNPIEGLAREAIWTPTAIALIGELGVGTVTASALQMGLGIAAIAGALGGVLFLFGIGLIWASSVPEDKKVVEASKVTPGAKLLEGAHLPA